MTGQRKITMPRGARVTINFGLSNTVEKQFPENTTIGDVLANSGLRAVLGFGDNAVAKIDGSVQPNGADISDGDVIDIEVKAQTKA
jgi:sulfur carrier protein ThiS